MKEESLFKNFNSDKIIMVISIVIFLVVTGIALVDEFMEDKEIEEAEYSEVEP